MRLGRFGGSPTLSATELLHESLVGIIPSAMEWKDRAHFFATMSLAMRSVLVDHARARTAEKRGGDRVRVTLDESIAGDPDDGIDLLALDGALAKLEAFDARSASIVHLTYFSGLSRQEIGEMLQTSARSIDRELKFARGWLRVELRGGV
jgi:RNA polymerase sigma factor (TIGR02999 family)